MFVKDSSIRPLRWHHTSLAVADIDQAITFHRDAFGFEVAFLERGMDAQIASMTGVPSLVCDLAQMRCAWANQVLEFVAFRHADGSQPEADLLPIRPGAAHVAFYVEDLNAALRRVKSLGAVPLGTITAFSDGRSVYCRAPGGSFFEMEEPFEVE